MRSRLHTEPHENADTLSHTQVGHVDIRTDTPIAVEPFARTPELGRFVLMRSDRTEAGGIVIGDDKTT